MRAKSVKMKRITEYALDEWKRVVLRPLRLIYMWTVLAEILLFALYQPTEEISRATYCRDYVVLPLILMLVIIVLLWSFYRKAAIKLPAPVVSIVTILLLNLYVAVNICIFSNLKYMMITVFFPIIIAPVYRKKKLIFLQVALSLGILLFSELYYVPFHPVVPQETVFVDVIVMLLLFYAMVRFELEVITSSDMLDMQSSKDSLTHLFNHETFYETLDGYMTRYLQTKETFSIIIADIDNFKKVNDTYGHTFGDEVIKKVTEVLLRTKGTKDLCARYGGEEFAIIMPNKGISDAILQAEKIRKEFEKAELQTEDGSMHRFTISLGVAEYNREYKTASAFFEVADRALYEAKRTGKNRVCCSR